MFKTDGEPGRDKLDLQFLMENLDSQQFQLVHLNIHSICQSDVCLFSLVMFSIILKPPPLPFIYMKSLNIVPMSRL